VIIIVSLLVACTLLASAEEDFGRPPVPPTTKAPTLPSHGHGRPTIARPTFAPWEPRYTPYELRNINITKTLYAGLIYPNALNIVTAGQYPAGIFADNAGGRITPVGEFTDQEGTFEYFYGLAANTDIVSATFPKLIARDNIVAFQVTLLIDHNQIGAEGLQNLTQEGFITFDDNSLIISYDLAILRLGQATVVTPSEYPAVIQNICTVADQYCVGNLTQYASHDACVAELTTVNFGTWDNLQSNTTSCRMLHSTLVPLRPWYHCPHIGPTGGNACIDLPYSEYYSESF